MANNIVRLNNADPHIAAQILDVSLAAYEHEARLISFRGIPYLNETVTDVEVSEEVFYGHYADERLTAVLSVKLIDGIVDIHRLVVYPQHFRKGIALSLLEFIFQEYNDAQTFIVSAAGANLPALALYGKAGFIIAAKEELKEGVTVVRFEKLPLPM